MSCFVESESFRSGLGIEELGSVWVAGTAECSRKGFQGGGRFAPRDWPLVDVVGGRGAKRLPVSANLWDERGGGRQERRVSPDGRRQGHPK